MSEKAKWNTDTEMKWKLQNWVGKLMESVFLLSVHCDYVYTNGLSYAEISRFQSVCERSHQLTGFPDSFLTLTAINYAFIQIQMIIPKFITQHCKSNVYFNQRFIVFAFSLTCCLKLFNTFPPVPIFSFFLGDGAWVNVALHLMERYYSRVSANCASCEESAVVSSWPQILPVSITLS